MGRVCVTISILAIIVFAAGSIAVSDTLELKDGSTVTGKYVGRTDNGVSFEVGGIKMTYPAANVKAITFGDSTPAYAPAPPAPAPAAAAPVPQPVSAPTVPAGTRLMVRMKDSLDSKRHGPGHVFAATLDADLYAGGAIVAPRGSNVYGRLTSAKRSGRMIGQAQLSVELTDIVINGKPHSVVTSGVKAIGERTGVDTAKKTAVATGIGALIDGSKGAKIGAGVGLGASALTSGSQVNIPSGTLLEFRLAAPFMAN